MRTHIVQSWVGACEYDEGDTYNGQQIGNRNQKSIGVLIERSGDQWKAGNVDQQIPTFINGRANVAAFAEPVTKPKVPAKKTSAFSQIMLADKNYTRLCGLSEQLDQELDAGHIPDFESYCAARKNIDKRLATAWLRVCKERNWNESGESLDNSLDSGLSFSLEDIQEVRDIGEKQRVKRELTGNEVFDSLSETNVFLGLFIKVKKIMKIMKALNNREK